MKNPFSGPPRDPKRIPEILNRLEQAWLKQPDTRLGQLLINALHKDGMSVVDLELKLWYTEDDELIEHIEAPMGKWQSRSV